MARKALAETTATGIAIADNPQSAGTVLPAWPADHVERRSLDELEPFARNAKLHSEQQVEQLAASIREWGWTIPVLIDEAGSIIAGHGRVLAAHRLGLVDVPVMIARGWTDEQTRAYRIADNKLTENGSWDQAMLRLEIADLADLGFGVPLLGFSDSELAGLAAFGRAPDEFPEHGEDIQTEHQCPKCGYVWSGSTAVQGADDGKE